MVILNVRHVHSGTDGEGLYMSSPRIVIDLMGQGDKVSLKTQYNTPVSQENKLRFKIILKITESQNAA